VVAGLKCNGLNQFYDTMSPDSDPLWVRIMTVVALYFAAIAVLALALAILRARNVSTKVRQPVFEIKLERRAFGSAD
jgi:phage shock protein PspC (stress-responsive transcriptional regulator)